MTDETARLKALADYRLLDTPPEEGLDNIVRLASRILSSPTSLLTLVDEDRQWFKSRYGFERTQTPREWSFCAQALAQDQTLVVTDAAADSRFKENPLVVGDPYVRFYCGVPLRTPDGHGLGTLCVLGPRPRQPTAKEIAVLEGLARQLELELEIRRRLLMLEDRLAAAEERRRQRELLAAMFVHDVRGPLTTIALLASSIQTVDASLRLDLDEMLNEAERARRMLTDVLDICLHESGGLRPRYANVDLVRLASSVAEKQRRLSHLPTGAVILDPPHGPLDSRADPELIRRVLENLVGNAVHHGADDIQVTLALHRGPAGRIICEVRDHGPVIAAADRERIFEALAQGTTFNAHRGYGLGLTFCRLAIEAHGGTITVAPNPNARGNCFTFDLPGGAPTPAA